MQVNFMPDRQDAKDFALARMGSMAFLNAGRAFAWRGRVRLLPKGTALIDVGTYHLTIRTPEGMLVTYKPKRGTP